MKPSLRAGLAALVLSVAVAAPALAEVKVLAHVDGQPVTDQDVAQLMATMGQQLQQLPEPARKRAALDRLIDMKVIAAQAAKDGLDKSDEVQKRLEQVRQQLLINEYVKQKVDASITDAEVKARYEKDAAAFVAPEETKARHILVKTKEEATAIIADLDKGGDFAKIAEEKSQDPGSAKQGGDLGYFGPGDMVKPFEDAVAALKVGEYTKTPIETQFGFHVIKLDDRRKQKIPGLDEVKDQVRQALVGERFVEKLAEIKKGVKIDVDEAAVGAK